MLARPLLRHVGLVAAVLAGVSAAPRAQTVDVPLTLYKNADFPGGFAVGAGSGASFADVDGDGWVDLYVNLSGNLWRNVDGRTWRLLGNLNSGNVTPRYGASLGDYDRDGLVDLATAPRQPNCFRLFRNLGNSGFLNVATDPATVSRMPCNEQTETPCWADVDFDGDLDLFLPAYPPSISGGEQGNFFWQNMGPTGPGRSYRLVEKARAAGLLVPPGNARPEGTQFYDVDHDGDLDVYSNGALYLNVSAKDAPRFQALAESESGIGLSDKLEEGALFVDYDQDGDFDLLCSYVDTPGLIFWESFGDGTFGRAPPGRIELPRLGTDFGITAVDWDHDGDIDLTSRFAFRRNTLIETGKPEFKVATSGIKFSHVLLPIFAWADIDRDGDLDAAISNFSLWGDVGHVYRNTTYGPNTPMSERRHVRVRPVADSTFVDRGTETEFGATAEVAVRGDSTAAPPRRLRGLVSSSGGYLNQNEYALPFTIPDPAPKPEQPFDIHCDFPNDPTAGLWRVDRHVNPLLGELSFGLLSDREVSVYRSGRVVMNGCSVRPTPLESPLLSTTGSGLVLPTKGNPQAAALQTVASDTFIGLAIEPSQPTRVLEVVVDARFGSGPAPQLELWDVTQTQSAFRMHGCSVVPSTNNRRVEVPVDWLLQANHKYRVVARVTALRTTTDSFPSTKAGLAVAGSLRFRSPAPPSAAAVTGAAVVTDRTAMAVRYRKALVGLGSDLGGAMPNGGAPAQFQIVDSVRPGGRVRFRTTGLPPNAPVGVLFGLGVRCLPGQMLQPRQLLLLAPPGRADAQGNYEVALTWPQNAQSNIGLALQAWYLQPNNVPAASNVAWLVSP